jgi:hypothetical protein
VPGARGEIELLLESWRRTPAIARDRHLDVLAANRAAAALCPLLEAGRNLATSAFLGDSRFGDSGSRLTETVAGMLHDSLEEHEEDPRFVELIGELATRSARFGSLWNAPTRSVDHAGEVLMQSKYVGELSMRYQELRMPLENEFTVIVFRPADAVSESRYDRLLRLLAVA